MKLAPKTASDLKETEKRLTVSIDEVQIKVISVCCSGLEKTFR